MSTAKVIPLNCRLSLPPGNEAAPLLSPALFSHCLLHSTLRISLHRVLLHQVTTTTKMSTPDFSNIKALLFDVFGTVVDWQGSVHRLLEKRAKSEGIELGDIDLLNFTQQWRAGYMRRT